MLTLRSMMCLHQLPVNGGAACEGEIRRRRLGWIGPIPGRLLANSLPNSYDASGICTHALRLVMPAIGAGPGVLAQRSGALAVWATGEPILVYRRAANEPSPALAAAQRQSKVQVPADGPLRDARKGHWATFGPLSLRLPPNSGAPVAQTTPVRRSQVAGRSARPSSQADAQRWLRPFPAPTGRPRSFAQASTVGRRPAPPQLLRRRGSGAGDHARRSSLPRPSGSRWLSTSSSRRPAWAGCSPHRPGPDRRC